MKCPSTTAEGNATLMDYCAGQLERSRLGALEIHLRDCESCAVTVRSQKALWEALDDWDPEPISFGFDRMLHARIEESRTKSFLSQLAEVLPQWVVRPAMPLVAAALLIAAVLLIPRSLQRAANDSVSTAPVVTPVDAEELNRAMDDLQLLRQLDQVKEEASSASKKM
jgi:anti-sigma factor RsiW